jgi:hypothetical protein
VGGQLDALGDGGEELVHHMLLLEGSRRRAAPRREPSA